MNDPRDIPSAREDANAQAATRPVDCRFSGDPVRSAHPGRAM